jgi:hypothetical protein
MKTIQSFMTFSEMREYGHLRHADYERIKKIVEKPFIYVTTGDLHELSKTDIFGLSFTDLLFTELWKRYTNEPENVAKK